MQGSPRGLRRKWAQGLSAHASSGPAPSCQASEDEHDDALVDDDTMGSNSVDLTLDGELEIEVPPVHWPATQPSSSHDRPHSSQSDLRWLDQFAKEQAQAHIRQNLNTLKQPWERGPLAGLFNPKMAWPRPAVNLGLPSIGAMETLVSTSHIAKEPALPSSATTFAQQRVRQMRLHRTDDDVRRKSLDRVSTMMLMDCNATNVGRSLITFAGTLVADTEIVNSISDVFGPKSTGTILKRTNAMWRFAQWLHKQNLGSPFVQSEAVIYRYVSFLKVSGAAPTTASHFLESLQFFNGLLGFAAIKVTEVLSARVKGSAHVQYIGKRIRKPAETLTQREVGELEAIALTSNNPLHVILAGHFLFCLFAAARWYDSMYVCAASVSNYKGVWLVEAETSRHKTSMTKQMQTELLPFTALGRAFDIRAWADPWMKAREAAGLQPGYPFLPSWSEVAQRWMDDKMTSAEASSWLRELLAPTSGVERAAKLTIHGLKATLISWAAKSLTFSPEELTALGHHVSKAHRSAMIYSRDNQIALAVKVHNMLARMRAGLFQPDLPRVVRLFDLAAEIEREHDECHELADSESESAQSDDSCVASSGDELDGSPKHLPRMNPMDIRSDMCVVHHISSIIHVKKPEPDGDTLGCGRLVSHNFRPAEDRDLGGNKSLVCTGCSRYWHSWYRDS